MAPPNHQKPANHIIVRHLYLLVQAATAQAQSIIQTTTLIRNPNGISITGQNIARIVDIRPSIHKLLSFLPYLRAVLRVRPRRDQLSARLRAAYSSLNNAADALVALQNTLTRCLVVLEEHGGWRGTPTGLPSCAQREALEKAAVSLIRMPRGEGGIVGWQEGLRAYVS